MIGLDEVTEGSATTWCPAVIATRPLYRGRTVDPAELGG